MSDLSRLIAIAEEEVSDLLKRLPPPLRRAAGDIPLTCGAAPSPAQVQDGVDPDLMGLFVGDPRAAGNESPTPRQIFLFVQNIHDEVDGDPHLYREEVRRTYLHELGHYLGLEEQDLEDRGIG